MSKEFSKLRKIVSKLRKECPWDREQTAETLIKDLLSEAKEVELAIKNKDPDNLRDEIGDVILVAMMIAQICEEKGDFKVEDSLNDVSAKMKRRHPHVFGNAIAKTPDDALRLFYEAKKKEKDEALLHDNKQRKVRRR